jgi:hypothetical protein
VQAIGWTNRRTSAVGKSAADVEALAVRQQDRDALHAWRDTTQRIMAWVTFYAVL